MEEGATNPKKTVFIGGIGEDVDQAVLLETFSTFGAFALGFLALTVLKGARRRHN
jgi:hypothetical protein